MKRAALLALTLAFATAGASPGDDDPWAALAAVRTALLAAGPTESPFVQTFVPAGFSRGEEESGRLALALPDCLRWDYLEPYPKSFLLCGEEAWAWNPADRTGRRYPVDRTAEPALDLVLLSLEQLRARYEAKATPGGEGRLTVDLAPRAEGAGGAAPPPFASAQLVVDVRSARLVEVATTDREGNRTRFVLSESRPLAQVGTFSPPEGIVWSED